MGAFGLDRPDVKYGRGAACCELENVLFGAIRFGEFLDRLRK